MEIVYKLTNKDNKTRVARYNQKEWGENVTHTECGGRELCGPSWLHAYSSPLLAVLLNHCHSCFDERTMRLWECEAEVGLRHPDKIGCTKITTIRQIPLPKLTTVQRQAFAILAAKEVYKEQPFQKWSDKWLSGEDRSTESARKAVEKEAVDRAAIRGDFTVFATTAAIFAATASICPASDRTLPYFAAFAAIHAGESTTYAAAYAVQAGESAAKIGRAVGNLDLAKIAEKALTYS